MAPSHALAEYKRLSTELSACEDDIEMDRLIARLDELWYDELDHEERLLLNSGAA